MAALSASRLVWLAMPPIVSTICPISSLFSPRPVTTVEAAPTASLTPWAACACSEDPWATASMVAEISPTARPVSSEIDASRSEDPESTSAVAASWVTIWPVSLRMCS